jgi:hypothetical protein
VAEGCCCFDQRLDALHDIGQDRRATGQCFVDEPGRDRGAGQIGDQPHTPLDRYVLEHQQVDHECPEVRSIDVGVTRARLRWRLGDMGASARAAYLVHPTLTRYADDLVACCHSRQQAEQIKALLDRLREVADPRRLRGLRHPLLVILVLNRVCHAGDR